MKITVKTSQLLSQLPKDIRYALISGGDGLPESFTFDATEAVPDQLDKMELEYPSVRKVLTGMEWVFFCEMMGRLALGASIDALACHLKGGSYTTTSNSVAVHIKTMRNKFRSREIPFEIETIRRSHEQPGRYRLHST